MRRTIPFVVCLVVVASGFVTKMQKPNIQASIVSVEDLEQYLYEHPELNPLQELTKVIKEGAEPFSDGFKNSTFVQGERTAGKFENQNIVHYSTEKKDGNFT